MVFNRLSTFFVDNVATPLKQQVFSILPAGRHIVLVRIVLEGTLFFVRAEVVGSGFTQYSPDDLAQGAFGIESGPVCLGRQCKQLFPQSFLGQ